MAPGPPRPVSPATTTLVSLAVELALRNGNPDTVRDQLGADPAIQQQFDLALMVQQARGDAPEADAKRRLSMRTEDEVEKRRAARDAATAMADEERQALRAGDGEGLTGLLSPLELSSLPKPELLVEDFLVKDSVVRLYGPPKSYKSFVMLDIAACVGAGIAWHGKKTTAAKVLYVVAEGARGIHRRVLAWEAQNRRPMAGVTFYPKAVQLGSRDEVKSLIATSKKGGYEFIILDTQARCTVGLEENSASEMGLVVAALDVLKEVTGACVALVHHSGASGGRARGSTAILGALDAEFEVKPDKRNSTVEFITQAQKDLAEQPSFEMDLVTPAGGHALAVRHRPTGTWYQATAADTPPLSDQQAMILRTLGEYGPVGASPSTVCTDLGWETKQRGSVQKVMGRLVERAMIHRENGNRYVITAAGKAKLKYIAVTDSDQDGAPGRPG